MDDLLHRPRWFYTDSTGPVDFHMGLPQRAWTVGTKGEGGSDVSGAGVPAAFQVRRDSLWHLTLRFREREWGNVERLVAHLQRAGSVLFFPDRLRSESHTIYGVSPAMGEEVTPRPGDEPSTKELDITVRPTTAVVVRRRYYSKALWRFSAGDDTRQVTFTRPGSVGAYRSFDGPIVTGSAFENQLRTSWRLVNGVLRPYTLLEVPRTNAVSAVLTSWSITNSGTWTGTTTGPDGSPTSGKGIAHGSGGAAFRANNVPTGTPTDDTVQAFSIYAKAADAGWCFVRFNRKDAALVDVYFDLVNGAIGVPDAGITGYIEALPNGWYHCEATCDVLSGGSTAQVLVGPADADGDESMAGAGAPYVYFFGPQWEMDAKEPSSLMLAAGSSRGAEAFSDVFPYTLAQLAAMGGATLYLDFIEGLVPTWSPEGGSDRRLVNVGGGSAPAIDITRPASGDGYRLNHYAASTVTSTVDLNPARGNRIQLAAQFLPTGAVRLLGRKNGVTDADGGASSALTPSSGGDGLIRLGGVGTVARGIQEYADAIVFTGLLDIAECEREARAA